MRWDALFSDYEGQMNTAHDDDWRAEVAERTRGERSSVELLARLGSDRGAPVHVTLADGETVTGQVQDSARAWLLLLDEASHSHLIPADSIAVVRGASLIAGHLGEVERRLDLTHTLRALSRDRVRVRVRTAGAEVHGLVAAVHADHIDVVDHPHVRASVPLAQIIEVVSG